MSATSQLETIASAALLDGVSVVELSRHVAGAYCGRLLAQLGATVCRFGPETDAAGSASTRAAMQRALHAGKAVLPFTAELVGPALAGADIVIVEIDDRDDALAEHIDRIVRDREGLRAEAKVVVLSANGSTDGYRAGCGLTSSAWAGMSWAIGEPSREPLTPPYDIADYETGASAACAALVALVANAGPALGPIDVASRDVLAQLVSTLAQNYVPYGRQWQRDGRRPFMSGGIYPLGLFSCKDGYVALYCRSTEQWRSIVRAMGDPEWSRDERFQDPRIIARKHGDEVDTYLLPWLMQHTKAELMELGIRFGFPASPVRFVGEALDDPQFAFRKSLCDVALGDGTSVKVPSEPWRLYERAATTPRAGSGLPLAANSPAAPSKFLEGVRVLDLSWVWSGPLVTSVLADLGAEVIKVEHPSRLDSVRQRGRPIRDGKEVEGPVEELNPWFNQLNHGKKSVILDIKSDAGKAQILALAAICDIVVENMRPGALDKLGLGYDAMSAANPTIVMLSMSLAGRAGPLSQMKGYAGIMTSMAGLESLVGHEEQDGAQIVTGMAKTALGDPNAAAHAVCVLMAALHRRRRTGRGLLIDLSQTDAILSILTGPLIETQLEGAAPIMGNRHPLYAPYGHFHCSGEEQWVALAVQTEAQWQRLLAAVEDPGLQRFASLDADARIAARGDIEHALEGWIRLHSSDEIVSRLMAANVPVAPVASYQTMVAATWRSERSLTVVTEHPCIGRQELVVPPWRYGAANAGVDRSAPLLGADTDAVLASLDTGERAQTACAA